MQSNELSVPLFKRIIRFPDKLSISFPRHGKEIPLRRLISHALSADDALHQASNILSTVFERSLTVRIGTQDERHVDLDRLQLCAVVLVLVRLEGVDHGL